jgi:iron complex outermembrane recepter protein
MYQIPFTRTALGAAIFAATTTMAVAQPMLEEVVVTAQKRTESLQDVPISVNAVAGDKMMEAGITNMEALTAYVPNFSMNQTGLTSNITIRGISSGVNQAFEQSVGMYVDDIYYGRAQLARSPLLDLERIEVLRGPQPILFGKNSIGGAVSMITAKPSDEFEGSIQGLYEPDHGEQDYRVVLSGPMSDTLSGRLSLLYREMDGYMDNAHLDRDEKAEEESVIRASLRWEPTDRLTMNVKVERTTFDTEGRNVVLYNSIALPGGTDYLSALAGAVSTYNDVLIPAGLRAGPEVPYTPIEGKFNWNRAAGIDESDNEMDNFTFKLDYELDAHTLTLVSGYVTYDTEEICDCDFASASIIDGTKQFEEYEQFSQEIRLTSQGGETFDYIVGAYYQTNELDISDITNVPEDSLLRLLAPPFAGISARRNYEADSDAWSVFAQGTWNINDVWRLTVGGRYTSEDKEGSRMISLYQGETGYGDAHPLLNALFAQFGIEAHSIEDDRDESAFTPIVTLQWDVSDEAMIYATYVTGFKSGGFDLRSNGHPDPAVGNPGIVGVFEFEEEEATSYEIGAKMGLLDGRAELNVAAFFTDYDDLQTSVFDGILGFNVNNAGGAEIKGVELDGRWLISEGFTLSGSVGFLDFEFTEFPNSQCYFGQTAASCAVTGTADASGERKEYTPEWKWAITGDYVTPIGNSLEFRATADVSYVDEYTAVPNLDPKGSQDSYTRVNARMAVGAADGTWEVALVGKNLTDEKVLSFGGNATLAGPLTGGGGNAYYGFIDRPLSVAVQGLYRF